jgi:hypothetical protein
MKETQINLRAAKKTRRDTQEMRHSSQQRRYKKESFPCKCTSSLKCCKQQRPWCGGMIMNVMMMIEDDDSVSFPKQALQTPLNCRLIPSEFVLMPVMPMTLPSVVCSRSKNVRS